MTLTFLSVHRRQPSLEERSFNNIFLRTRGVPGLDSLCPVNLIHFIDLLLRVYVPVGRGNVLNNHLSL
jgi:hypothetical protein